jgi:hypothetical protein
MVGGSVPPQQFAGFYLNIWPETCSMFFELMWSVVFLIGDALDRFGLSRPPNSFSHQYTYNKRLSYTPSNIR